MVFQIVGQESRTIGGASNCKAEQCHDVGILLCKVEQCRAGEVCSASQSIAVMLGFCSAMPCWWGLLGKSGQCHAGGALNCMAEQCHASEALNGKAERCHAGRPLLFMAEQSHAGGALVCKTERCCSGGASNCKAEQCHTGTAFDQFANCAKKNVFHPPKIMESWGWFIKRAAGSDRDAHSCVLPRPSRRSGSGIDSWREACLEFKPGAYLYPAQYLVGVCASHINRLICYVLDQQQVQYPPIANGAMPGVGMGLGGLMLGQPGPTAAHVASNPFYASALGGPQIRPAADNRLNSANSAQGHGDRFFEDHSISIAGNILTSINSRVRITKTRPSESSSTQNQLRTTMFPESEELSENWPVLAPATIAFDGLPGAMTVPHLPPRMRFSHGTSRRRSMMTDLPGPTNTVPQQIFSLEIGLSSDMKTSEQWAPETSLNKCTEEINLAIWDTAGQERFHALGPIYYRMSNGAILVYDITDEDSFQKVKNWVKELKKMLGSEICLSIAGNKVDLEKERNVPVEVAEEYARSVGAVHFHTSAKLNVSIEELFLELTQRMMERAQQLEMQKANELTRTNSMRRNIVVVDEDEPAAPTRTCCGTT
ncbi:unnamed protein product [Nesidiocoris tenuis]|uniref:Ras-related protein Rab-21 n=1 Tax=Nesidiocoris tenuis TaxID=355587 RepID=A0A6H5G5B4_9HEMI|nr:unnamed protein product [Nesidiocoris tenuis]